MARACIRQCLRTRLQFARIAATNVKTSCFVACWMRHANMNSTNGVNNLFESREVDFNIMMHRNIECALHCSYQNVWPFLIRRVDFPKTIRFTDTYTQVSRNRHHGHCFCCGVVPNKNQSVRPHAGVCSFRTHRGVIRICGICTGTRIRTDQQVILHTVTGWRQRSRCCRHTTNSVKLRISGSYDS